MLRGALPFLQSIPRAYYLWMLAASLLSISPLLAGQFSDPVRHVGGDSWVYLIWMQCFSQQLWQGDLYPRWCMDMNSGLGTPIFMLYFPLPFYFAALFYPLNLLGLSYYGLYIVLCFLVTCLSMLACFSWLRDVVKPPVALLCAVLYVFLPYHADLMLFRGVYTELCAALLAPLFFKYLRRLCLGEAGCLQPLALVTGLLLLTQVMIAALALLFGGLYALLMSRRLNTWLRYAAGAGWGVALAGFYLIPGQYFRRFLGENIASDRAFAWPGKYFGLHLLEVADLQRPFVGAVATIIIFVACAVAGACAHRRIVSQPLKRETLVWMALGAASVCMMFPASAPVYAVLDHFVKLIYPWRMQMIITLIITFVAAVRMQYQLSPARLKTWRMDFALALGVLWLLSQYVTATFSPQGEALKERITAAGAACTLEDRPRWVDVAHWECEYMTRRAQTPHAQAEIVAGKGSVRVMEWGWRAIRVSVGSKEGVTLRLNHVYFPVWKAWLDRSRLQEIKPEPATGQMLLEVPAGGHEVLLTHSILHAAQWLVVADIISAGAWVFMAIALWRGRGQA